MTKLGKILIFVNLAISLSLMIWAINLFLVRIDWSDNKANKSKPGGPFEDGTLVALKAKVVAAWRPLVLAEPQWLAARTQLADLEASRRATRRWYEQQLALLDKAPNPKQPPVVREVVLAKGLPEIIPNPDPRGAVKLAMKDTLNPALNAANVYVVKENELFNGVPGEKEGLYEAKRKLRVGVEEVVGAITKTLGPKGLFMRGKDEQAKREGIIAEYEAVVRPYVNTAVDSQFALDREKYLKARVQELEAYRQELVKKLNVAGGGKE